MASAPVFEVPDREVFAVEHPMIVKNVDNAIKTFGNGYPFKRILHSVTEASIPLYLRPHQPMSGPIMSYNAATQNVLLKVTTPKRTGRKRKRGSQEPYVSDRNVSLSESNSETSSHTDGLRSHSRQDNSAGLLRTLRDNSDGYSIEVVGRVEQTHRFRGLSDFQHSGRHATFQGKLHELIAPAQVEKLREFNFDLSRGPKACDEIVPPPAYTTMGVPFNWAWRQNTHVFTKIDPVTGQLEMFNKTKNRRYKVQYIQANSPDVPQKPEHGIPNNVKLRNFVKEVKVLFEERPLWTRRALQSHLQDSESIHLLKSALYFVAYQFKGGPFRDAVIKIGLDPRKDPKYRKYQTLFFKLFEEQEKGTFTAWEDKRVGPPLSKDVKRKTDKDSYLFNGTSYTLDGMVWQLCDITDPLLARLINNATLRDEYNLADGDTDGWFCNGAYARIRAIMKTKLLAIRIGKVLTDEDFEEALRSPDIIENNTKPTRSIHIPMPDIRLTEAEIEEKRAKGDTTIVLGPKLRRKKYLGKSRIARLAERREKAAQTNSNAPSIATAKTPSHPEEVQLQDDSVLQSIEDDVNINAEDISSGSDRPDDSEDSDGEDVMDDLEDVVAKNS